MGELLSRLSSLTGVPMRAAQDIKDQKVTVRVRNLTLSDLRAALAELYGYRWSTIHLGGRQTLLLWEDLRHRQLAAGLRDRGERLFRSWLRQQFLLAQAAQPGANNMLDGFFNVGMPRNEGWDLGDPATLATTRFLAGLPWNSIEQALDGHPVRIAASGLSTGALDALDQIAGAAMPLPGLKGPFHLAQQHPAHVVSPEALSAARLRIYVRRDEHGLSRYLYVAIEGIPVPSGTGTYLLGIGPGIGAAQWHQRLWPAAPDDSAVPSDPGLQREVAIRLPKKPTEFTLDDLLALVHAVTGCNIVSDYHTKPAGQIPPLPRLPLYRLLDVLTSRLSSDMQSNWWQAHNCLMFRSKRWYLDDAEEIPAKVLRSWREERKDQGFLGLGSLAQMAALDADQLRGLARLFPEALPVRNQMRPYLRFYGSLAPAERIAAASPNGLDLSEIDPARLRLLVDDNYHLPQPSGMRMFWLTGAPKGKPHFFSAAPYAGPGGRLFTKETNDVSSLILEAPGLPSIAIALHHPTKKLAPAAPAAKSQGGPTWNMPKATAQTSQPAAPSR